MSQWMCIEASSSTTLCSETQLQPRITVSARQSHTCFADSQRQIRKPEGTIVVMQSDLLYYKGLGNSQKKFLFVAENLS